MGNIKKGTGTVGWTGKVPRRSIVLKISIFIALSFVVILGLLVGYFVYSIRTASQNIQEQQLRVMRVHTQQISTAADNANASLKEMVLGNLDEASSIGTMSAYQQYLASRSIIKDFEVKVQNNSQLTGVYFVAEEGDLLLYRCDSSMAWKQKIALEDYLKGEPSLQNDVTTGSWHIINLQGDCYLQQNYRIGQGYFGVLISLDMLLKERQGEENAESIYMFTTSEGMVLLSEDASAFAQGDFVQNDTAFEPTEDNGYIVFTEEVGAAGLRLSCAVPTEDVYAGMQRMQYLLVGIALGFLALVALLWIYLQRNIVKPIQTLAAATREIEQGNIEYQIQGDPHFALEFSNLIGLFNKMTREIKNLKIQNYEEMLERKNAELKYLQMQLRPHFYLNAITTISSLSMRGENDKIQEFIQALSTYLRYLLTDKRAQATVEGEVQHAVAFIRLQQIRHQDKIFYYQSVDRDVADVPIQRLLVQTFVENVFKHAFDGEQQISIYIRARRVDRDGEPFVRITIEDTGCGFPEEMLSQGGSQGKGSLGSENVRKTLSLTYGRDDLLQLSNNEQGGAQVDIYLPLGQEGEKHEPVDRG